MFRIMTTAEIEEAQARLTPEQAATARPKYPERRRRFLEEQARKDMLALGPYNRFYRRAPCEQGYEAVKT